MNQPNDTPPISKPKNSSRSLTRRRFLQVSGLIAAGTGAELYAHRHEASHLVVETTEVAIAGWPAGRAPFRIGQLSDFHCDFPEALARTHHAVRMLLAQKPDIVVLTGDFVSGLHADKWIGPCAEALAPLAVALPGRVYGVLGNHDWWCGGRRWIRRRLEHVGVHMLLNASVPIPDVPGCHLVGLDDPLCGAARPEKALRGIPAHDVKILLAHEPD
ncbi:MAG: metallophosphoesterase, partial [Capsulimonas sp.]|uniref:metallophosphoesterase n=1 Tax=Capsulimonas sp. TaxID=2494211 RepID=UPI003262D73E